MTQIFYNSQQKFEKVKFEMAQDMFEKKDKFFKVKMNKEMIMKDPMLYRKKTILNHVQNLENKSFITRIKGFINKKQDFIDNCLR